MKKTTLTILIILFNLSAFARGGGPETEADYIVPTPPEFVPYSRFKVKIVESFKGPETQRISYVFPEFLVGQADRVVSLTRIPGTENSWTSPELNAHCTVTGDEFSCNIYVNKTNQMTNKETSLLTRELALSNLPRLNFSEEEMRGFEGVINAFYSHEPAGFLSYDID